jgi:uncharacterized repeat protein (TIGR02543 family)
MVDRYFTIKHPDSKYRKDVPYITKKQMRDEKSDYKIIGETSLKKYKSEYDEDKQIKVITFPKVDFLIKDNVFGFKKGYILLQDEECVVLKTHIPFLFLLFLFLFFLLFLSFVFTKPKDEVKPVINPPIINEPIIDGNQEPIIDNTSDIPNVSNNKSYSIYYHLNGGTEVKNPSSYTKGQTLKLNNPSKRGYEFKGWFDNPEYKGKQIDKISSSMKGKKDLYAKWQSISYKIELHNDNESKVISCNYDQDCKLGKEVFQKEGHSFIGWSLNPNDAIVYKDDAIVKNLSSENGQVIDLYANWEVNEYSIVFKDYDDSIIQDSKLQYGTIIEFPEDRQRLGYEFKGWDNDSKIVKDNLIITAKYKTVEYNIDYELNNGVLDNPINDYNIESEDIILASPTKKGYTFKGWSDETLKIPEIDLKILSGSTGDKKFIANWEANEYEVTLNQNGGTVEDNVCLVRYDSNYSCLSIPKKDGYEFIGWYDDEDTKITEDTILDKDYNHDLLAKWDIVNYDIAYELNGGTINSAINSYNVESESFKIEEPTKRGYEFIGWNVNDNSDLIKDLNIEKGTTGNIQLIANYNPICYSIVYNPNGGNGTMNTTKVCYDQEIKLSQNKFEYLSKKFIGWSNTSNGDVEYLDEDLILNLTDISDEIITLNAQWETIYYNAIYYDWNGEIVKEEKVPYQTETNPPEDMYRGGYTFISWDNQDFVILRDTEYHPIFQKNQYNIKYNLNTGLESDIKNIEYNIESNDIVLPTPEREGYTFLGWKDMETIEVYENVIIPKGSVRDKEYKAEWKANQYTITFNPNGGSMINTVIKVSYNSLYGILPNVSREGYTFAGWYYQNSLVTEDTVLKINHNHELTARWNPINYNISYNLNGGNASGLVNQYNIETSTFTLPTPTRSGYIFTGWTGSNGSTPNKNVAISEGTTGNLNYTANWQASTFSISYNLDGGTANGLITSYTNETDSFTLPIPKKSGYNFRGWTGSNSTNPQTNVIVTKGTTGNLNYTANWEKYSSTNSGGIYMISTRNNVTWDYNLDGYYNVGDTNVHSGNWIVTVSDYCVDIVGTKYPATAFNYQFYIYKANNTSEMLAQGNASVLGNYQNNAVTRICW